jgi:hypothetical protein
MTELSTWSRVLLQKEKFPAYYATGGFITAFTISRNWSLPWIRWIQFTSSQYIPLRSILMLSSHLRLGLTSGLFPSGFLATILSFYILQNHLNQCYMFLRDISVVLWKIKLSKYWWKWDKCIAKFSLLKGSVENRVMSLQHNTFHSVTNEVLSWVHYCLNIWSCFCFEWYLVT